jgi:DNA-binding HxlR family transcriptional regulator
VESVPFDVFAEACPSRLVLRRIGDKWVPLILLALQRGRLRFTALSRQVVGVTPKVLTQSLRDLERDGLIRRTVHAEVPPRVEYELTDLGHTLIEPLQVIRAWAESHAATILAARGAYDAAS